MLLNRQRDEASILGLNVNLRFILQNSIASPDSEPVCPRNTPRSMIDTTYNSDCVHVNLQGSMLKFTTQPSRVELASSVLPMLS